MKRVMFALMMGLFMCPLVMDAKVYKKSQIDIQGLPHRSPALYQIGVYVDSESGDLYISPNYDVTGLQITLVGNGVTYLNTTVSLSAGQVFADNLDFLDEGTYTLTLSTSAGVISQYTITVEDE